MSRKRIALAFAIAIIIFSAAIGYTTSASQSRGNDNVSRKPGRAPAKAVAAKNKAKKSRGEDDEKKGKKRRERQESPKVIRLDPNADKTPRGPISKTADSFAVSPELKSIPEVMNGMPEFLGEVVVNEDEENNKPVIERTVPEAWGKNSAFQDPLASLTRAKQDSLAPQAMPAPSLTFNGIHANDLPALFGGISMPPDTVGDVGPNHYVQAANSGVFRVFNKATGAPLTAPAKISSVFSGFAANHPCRTIDDGDPVVNYDPLADRWLVSQFQVTQSPMGQCIAVSQTGDPTGSWFAYYFTDPNGNFPDYPHWGVWTDGYYLATHEFNNVTDAYVQGGFFAFNRDKMLAGDATANYVYFARAASYGHLPADIDGYMPPPAGTPAMFFEISSNEFGGTDSLLNYEFVPNFTTPANSTLTIKPAIVAITPFDPRTPDGRTHIEQPSPAAADGSNNLDSIGGQLMFRVAYRNLGTTAVPVNSYVMNWTVNVSGAVPTSAGTYQAAPRWTELRRSAAGAMSVFDEGTHAPDAANGTGRNRWMGSIAQDYLGNLALGFSRSGPGAAEFPDIVWAGRTGGQISAGAMNEGETTMFASSGVQQSLNSRWGDYSSMTVDPADDCTFWYTTVYRDSAFNGTASSNPFRWSTRIGKFKFPTCTAQPKGQIAANVTYCSSGTPVKNARVTATVGNFFRLTNAGGNLVSNIIAAPGLYTIAAGRGNLIPSSTTAAITDGNSTNVNLCLGGTFVDVDATTAAIASESCATNNAADPGELITVNLGLQNVEGTTTSNLTATLLPTGGVTSPSAPQNYGAMAANGLTATRSFTFTVDPNALPGSNITLTLALADGVENWGTATYTLPVGSAVGSTQSINYTDAVTAIPDGNTTGVNTTLNVSGFTGGIQDLNFVITGTAATPSTATGIDHTWIGDLVVKLTSPAGTTVTLIDQINSTTDVNGDCSSDNIFNTILDDSAANSIDNACPGSSSTSGPLTGTFKPQNPLSAFNGENPNGTWTLNVSDRVGGDTGSVRDYRLVITPSTAACTGRAVTGTVKYGTNLSKLVSNVAIGAAGSSSYSTNTSALGVYLLPGLIGGGNYTVTPTKTGDRNGITAFDATLVLRHVAAGGVGPNALNSNQQTAANADGAGGVTSFDATLILRYVAANGSNSNTGQVGNWRFNPLSRPYSPLSSSFSNEDYTAFLIGEVNGDWIP